MGHAPPIHAHALTRRGGVRRVATYACDTPTERALACRRLYMRHASKATSGGEKTNNAKGMQEETEWKPLT